MKLVSVGALVWLPAMCLLLVGDLAAQEPKSESEKPEFYSGDPQLQLLIREALDRNPGVRQSFARYQASLERLPQAGSLPDPMLGLTQYLTDPQTRVGPQTTMVTFSQQFPWFGKLSDKEKIAAKEAAVTREQYEAQRDEVVRQVKLAYYDLAYLDQILAITEQDLSVLQRYETLAQARYAQGIGLQQAALKLQAEITRDRNRLEALRSRRVDSEASLNYLIDRPAETPVARIAPVSRPNPEVNAGVLYQLGRDRRPEVQAAFLQIERDEERIQLARRNYWPDFTVGAGFVNVLQRSDMAGVLNPPDQNGRNVFGITVGMNIPIRRRKYDAAVTEATEDKIASRENYRNVVNRMEASIRAIGFKIQTISEQIALFEHTLIPQAERSLQSTETAYSTGSLGVLDLLDSERVLLDVRLGLAQLNSDYMKSLAEMERAVGASFPEARP